LLSRTTAIPLRPGSTLAAASSERSRATFRSVSSTSTPTSRTTNFVSAWAAAAPPRRPIRSSSATRAERTLPAATTGSATTRRGPPLPIAS